MASIQISDLTPFNNGGEVVGADYFPVVDRSASETKRLSMEFLAAALPTLFGDGSIPTEKINLDLPDGSVVTDDIANGAVTAGKLADNSTLLSGAGAPGFNGSYTGQLYFDSIGLALYTYNVGATSWELILSQSLPVGSVAGDQLADNSTATVNNSPPGAATGDYRGQLWIDAATETIWAWDGSQWVVAIDSVLQDDSVLASSIADNVITVSAAGTLPPGEYIGQVGYDTATGKLFIWNGTDWGDTQGSLSVNAINYGTGIVALTITQADDVVTIDTSMIDTTAPAQVLAGPTASAGATGYRSLVGGDLPVAGAANRGAIRVSGEGLRVNTDQLEIDNDIVPVVDTFYLCQLNAKGLVIDFREITPDDLPIATSTSNGVIKPGTDFEVDADGVLNLEDKVTPGVYTKVTVDSTGLISDTGQIDETDIPSLDADKIASGTLNPARIADESIGANHIIDYTTCYMQEESPGVAEYLGQFHYTPSTAQLRVYARGSAGNQWLPVGFGALRADNLRWGGTFDASTDKIMSVTDLGQGDNLASGASFPVPTNELSGLYLVCQVGGNGCTQPNIDKTTFTPGDWALCLGEDGGWIWIDAGATDGGGGGGGANYLNDLLDVSLDSSRSGRVNSIGYALRTGDLLQYDGESGTWKNSSFVDGGEF